MHELHSKCRMVWLFMAITTLATNKIEAQTKAHLVESKSVWSPSQQVVDTDLVRFKDAWCMVCCESSQAEVRQGALRVIISKDGLKWEPSALIESPTPGKLLSNPRVCVKPDGQLMLTAEGIVPNPQSPEPLPKFGGTVQTLAWVSNDGRVWSAARSLGIADNVMSGTVWHRERAYSYSHGCICGSAQTIRILSFDNNAGSQELFEQTVSGFFPDRGALTFVGDVGHCLMSRAGVDGGFQTAKLGIAKAPYVQWEWMETNLPLSSPSLIQLPDKRVIAAVGLYEGKERTSLCELGLNTGKLTELLVLLDNGEPIHVGLGVHDGHLWISYQALQQGRWNAYLAKVLVE